MRVTRQSLKSLKVKTARMVKKVKKVYAPDKREKNYDDR